MVAMGRYQKILVPVDGSSWSERAIPHAADIARGGGAELILLHVFLPPLAEYADQIGLAGQDAVTAELREQMRRYLADLSGDLRQENLNVTTQLVEGLGVASIICDYVTENDVDLVVMSTHGRTGLARFLFGSVAAKVVECVKVPVLLIHPEKA